MVALAIVSSIIVLKVSALVGAGMSMLMDWRGCCDFEICFGLVKEEVLTSWFSWIEETFIGIVETILNKMWMSTISDIIPFQMLCSNDFSRFSK